MSLKTSDYDAYATEYAAYVERRDDPMEPHLLDLLGDASDQAVLDAGCGEGYLARILAARGAHVTGIDLSPRLVALAQAKDPMDRITYRVADLSAPLSEYHECFDAVVSYFVLNDVEDYQGFISTLVQALRAGGHAVFAFNSPYAFIVRRRLTTAFFQSGTSYPSGLAGAGIKVRSYHRTLGEYLDAFLAAGLRLTRLLDVDRPEIAADRDAGRPLPDGEDLPRFMLLAFEKP